MRIEIVDARAERPAARALTVPAGTRAGEALELCTWLAPVRPGDGCGLAVFGEAVPREHELQEGDRLEVCPPLQMSPMEARRRRAAAQRAKASGKPR